MNEVIIKLRITRSRNNQTKTEFWRSGTGCDRVDARADDYEKLFVEASKAHISKVGGEFQDNRMKEAK